LERDPLIFPKSRNHLLDSLAADFGEKLQHELAEIGGDRGLARGNATVGQEHDEIGEELIHPRAGAEIANAVLAGPPVSFCVGNPIALAF
jgi:hypothetical protein